MRCGGDHCRISSSETFRTKKSTQTNRDLLKICRKCSKSHSDYIYRSAPICWRCFQDLIHKKFKSSICHGLRTRCNGVKVMILCDNLALSSIVLLHLFSRIARLDDQRLLIKVLVTFIDCGIIYQQTLAQRRSCIRFIQGCCDRFAFPLHVYRIEDVICDPLTNNNHSNGIIGLKHPIHHVYGTLDRSIIGINQKIASLKHGNIEKAMHPQHDEQPINVTVDKRSILLQKLFDTVYTLTSKQDLLRALKHQLLVRTAVRHHFKHVVLPYSSNRIAIQIIKNICNGNGLSMMLGSGLHRSINQCNLSVHYPLKAFLDEELQFYAEHEHIQYLQEDTIKHNILKRKYKMSLNEVTEKFINRLQRKFRQTIHTILSTGDKLNVSNDRKESRDRLCLCSLCLRYIERLSLHSDRLCYSCNILKSEMKQMSLLDHVLASTTDLRNCSTLPTQTEMKLNQFFEVFNQSVMMHHRLSKVQTSHE